MKRTKLILATLALVGIMIDFRVQAFPKPQQTDEPKFTVVDGFAFEGVAERKEPSRPNSTEQPQIQRTPRPVVTTSTTTELPSVARCRQNCRFQTTSEYNPVCGTDRTVYTNPGMLNCARNCGLDVRHDYWGPCDSEVRST